MKYSQRMNPTDTGNAPKTDEYATIGLSKNDSNVRTRIVDAAAKNATDKQKKA